MDERLSVGRRVVRSSSEPPRNADQLQAAAYELLIGKSCRSACDVGAEPVLKIGVDTIITHCKEVTA